MSLDSITLSDLHDFIIPRAMDLSRQEQLGHAVAAIALKTFLHERSFSTGDANLSGEVKIGNVKIVLPEKDYAQVEMLHEIFTKVLASSLSPDMGVDGKRKLQDILQFLQKLGETASGQRADLSSGAKGRFIQQLSIQIRQASSLEQIQLLLSFIPDQMPFSGEEFAQLGVQEKLDRFVNLRSLEEAPQITLDIYTKLLQKLPQKSSVQKGVLNAVFALIFEKMNAIASVRDIPLFTVLDLYTKTFQNLQTPLPNDPEIMENLDVFAKIFQKNLRLFFQKKEGMTAQEQGRIFNDFCCCFEARYRPRFSLLSIYFQEALELKKEGEKFQKPLEGISREEILKLLQEAEIFLFHQSKDDSLAGFKDFFESRMSELQQGRFMLEGSVKEQKDLDSRVQVVNRNAMMMRTAKHVLWQAGYSILSGGAMLTARRSWEQGKLVFTGLNYGDLGYFALFGVAGPLMEKAVHMAVENAIERFSIKEPQHWLYPYFKKSMESLFSSFVLTKTIDLCSLFSAKIFSVYNPASQTAVTPAPVTPAPVTPAPVTPAPVAPAPVAENPVCLPRDELTCLPGENVTLVDAEGSFEQGVPQAPQGWSWGSIAASVAVVALDVIKRVSGH